MKYSRRFIISSAHFNGEDCYEPYYECIDKGKPVPVELMQKILHDCHGHNFVIRVEVSGPMPDKGAGGTNILVDDYEIEKIVMQYHNKNLSVIDEFVGKRQRASTELIARKIAQKVKALRPDIFSVRVDVHETPDIFATEYA